MGRVYLAFDRSERPVAVKIVRQELSEQATFRLRFAREVHSMRAVSGPCTVNLISADLGRVRNGSRWSTYLGPPAGGPDS